MKIINIYLVSLFLFVFACSLAQTEHYITTPSNGQTVSGMQTIYVTPPANFTVSDVKFFIDSSLKATVSSAPYKYEWNTHDGTFGNGSHTLSIEMYDSSGTMLTDSITVYVAN